MIINVSSLYSSHYFPNNIIISFTFPHYDVELYMRTTVCVTYQYLNDKMMTYFLPNNYILMFTALNITKYIIKHYYLNDKMMTKNSHFLPNNYILKFTALTVTKYIIIHYYLNA